MNCLLLFEIVPQRFFLLKIQGYKEKKKSMNLTRKGQLKRPSLTL